MKSLLLLAALLLVPAAVSAQTWTFDGPFPNPTRGFSSTHGIAVSPDGRVWVQPFGTTVDSVQTPAGPFRRGGTVLVFDANGTEAACSPVRFLANSLGVVTDTLGSFKPPNANAVARSGRGMAADSDGNILISQFDTVFKIDYTSCGGPANTVRLLNRVQPFPGAALVAPGVDNAGNMYVTAVVPGRPIQQYDASFNLIGNAAPTTRGFNRQVLASPDGLNVFRLDYTTPYVEIFRRADEFSAFDSLGVTLRGFRPESAVVQPATGLLWFSSGSPNDLPNQDPTTTTFWQIGWYGFNLSALLQESGGIVSTVPVPVPSDSLFWSGQADGRARAIAFSPDGNIAYVGQFNLGNPATQKHVRGTAAEPAPGIATRMTLNQNQPNPVADATTISFGIETAGHVRIRVLDLTGREIIVLVDEALAAGNYTTRFEPGTLAAGVYVYTLEAGGQVASRRMLVIR